MAENAINRQKRQASWRELSPPSRMVRVAPVEQPHEALGLFRAEPWGRTTPPAPERHPPPYRDVPGIGTPDKDVHR